MWRELVDSLSSEAEFGTPATPESIEHIRTALGQEVPADLAGFLRELGSMTGPDGTDLVWPAERIATDNLVFRTDASFAELYMSFDSLMFFGDAGDGDHFGYLRKHVRAEIFCWSHETDSRCLVAHNLTEYLTRHLTQDEESGYWWQHA